MNTRKFINILRYLTYIYVIYELFVNPIESELMCILAFCLLISVEIILFSNEYYSLIAPKKAMLILPKSSVFTFGKFIKLCFYILLMYALYIKPSGQPTISWMGFLLTTIAPIELSLYAQKKEGILISQEKIFFSSFRDIDRHLNEISELRLDDENHSIELFFGPHLVKLIKVNIENYKLQKHRLEQLSIAISNINGQINLKR